MMRHSEVLTIFGCVLMALSCSVKEDRDMCPCRLVLDMSEVDTSVVKYAELVVGTSDGFLARETLGAADFEGGYTVPVPYGDVSVGVYYGAGTCVEDDGRLCIEYGNECPQVYMHSSFVRAEGELKTEKVLMKKNHCMMTIKVETEKDFPFRLEAKGCVDGYEPGGRPSEGDFMYAMHVDEDGMCRSILPRQTDDSLVLEVHDDTGVLKTFALGEYVAASGYDWNEENLRDLTISLDYSLTRVAVSVAGWRETFVFNVTI